MKAVRYIIIYRDYGVPRKDRLDKECSLELFITAKEALAEALKLNQDHRQRLRMPGTPDPYEVRSVILEILEQ